MSKNAIGLVGLRFGKLQALAKLPAKFYRVACDCGHERIVSASSLRSGGTRSCGCLKRGEGWQERTGARGLTRPTLPPKANRAARGTITHKVWRAMRSRCYVRSNKDYWRYGGRGVKVCARWNSYDSFLADMGERPSPRHSIDRIDPKLGYKKSNCRWATPLEQGGNRGNLKKIVVLGVEYACAARACAALGLSHKFFMGRIDRGWSPDAAATTPKRALRKADPAVH